MTTKIPAELSSTPGIVDNSDATAITITSGEQVLIGSANTTNNLRLQESFAIVSTGNLGGMSITGYPSSIASYRPLIDIQRSRGSSDQSMTKVESGDYLGSIVFRGADGTNFLDGAEISARADGATGTNDMPCNLTFHTQSDGGSGAAAERMRITSTGKVGIGSTSPDAMLKVVSNSASVVGSWIRGDNYGLRVSGGSSSSHYALRIANSSDSTLATFNGDGKVMIGGSSPSSLFQVNGTVAFHHAYSANATSLSIKNTVSSNDYFAQAFYSGSTLAGYIFIASSTNTTQFATSSDYRLKENVNYEFDALSRVSQLKPARFNFKSDAETTVDGFLAHEVSDVVPEAVVFEKDAVDEEGNPQYQGIDQSKLVPLLTKAMQEQQDIIEDLKSRIETLEG